VAASVVGLNGGSGCAVRNFHQFHLTHHERRDRPAPDHPQDKEEEERRASRRPCLLRLQEKEERTRRLSLCPDGRAGGFLELKGLSGTPSYLFKSATSLNATRNESPRLSKQCQQETIPNPPRLHPRSPLTIRPPQRLILSLTNLRLPRDDRRTYLPRLSRIRKC